RDVIAMSTVIGLSHNVFDGALLLGICDKIMPGLLMGGLQFGHLPMILVPGGPMRTGLPNREKALAREQFAQGKISKEEMLAVECASYHGAGTCTFYGTANSNQLIAEIMGLHLPGASFVNPDDPLREPLTNAASARICELTHLGGNYTPIGRVVSERSVVNGIVGLVATGGSTNQTMHLVAIARAAGIRINWDDFSEISDAVPLLVRIYPNGPGDINSFQAAGGMAVLIRELLEGGFLHNEVMTVAGPGLERYTQSPTLVAGKIRWSEEPKESREKEVIAPLAQPFSPSGGLKVVSGNLGRAVIKVSALADGAATTIEAPAMVFHTQAALEEAFQAGTLDRDVVAVIRFQGPQATGMPELHKLITPLAVVLGRGFRVAMVTDGRLSGASGKVPAAIHVTPEALCGGLLAKVR
ncbi:MAG: phosphogluconate dehydratase, partial [Deltaproteobacteria bacterium HGW-Deltaproteobacteria-16]